MNEEESRRKKSKETLKDRSHEAVIYIAFMVAYFFLKYTSKITLPILCSVIIYLVVYPLTNRFDKLFGNKKGFLHWVSTLISFLFIVLFLFLVAFSLFKTGNVIINQSPVYMEKFYMFDEASSKFLLKKFNIGDGVSLLSNLDFDLNAQVKKYMVKLTSETVNIFKYLSLIMLYTFFLLIERGKFKNKLLSLYTFDLKEKRSINVMMSRSIKQISKYLFIKLIASFVTGSLMGSWCYIVGMKTAVAWGFLGFLFNFIPSIGSIVITFLVSFSALLEFFPSTNQGLFVFTMTLLTQLVIGNILEPRFQGSKLNISAFIVLISLAIWGSIWGLVGMFFSVVLTSIIQIISSYIPYLKPFSKLISNDVMSDYGIIEDSGDKDDSGEENTEGELKENMGKNDNTSLVVSHKTYNLDF